MSSKCLSIDKIKHVDFQRSYHCGTCKKTFKIFIIFEGHFAFNAICRAKNGWFVQCYICRQRFRYLAELKYHLRRHKNERIDVNRTDSQIVDRSVNKKRKNEHSSGFQCIICQKRFSTEIHFNEHMGLHSNRTPASYNIPINEDKSTVATVNQFASSSLKCQTCKIVCVDSIALEHHEGTHIRSDKLKCLVCNISFTTEVSLKFHKKLFHQCGTPNKPKGIYALPLQCDICNAKFTYSHNLAKHKLVHTIGDEECEICHIKFTKSSLKLHEQEAHPELMDDEVSNNESQLDKQQNDEIGSIAVPQITSSEITLPTDSPRTSSISPHPHPPPLVCERCEMSFTTIHHLRQHIQAHRQYSCKICDKTLYTWRNLRKHQRSHTFECYVCKRNYRLISNVIAHMKKHIVYERWVDPMDVYLSNWQPEQSREILQNQPLVLVENLDISKMNTNFAISCDDKSTVIGSVRTLPPSMMVEIPPSIVEEIKRENETIVDSSVVDSPLPIKIEKSEQLLDNCQANIELKYSEQMDLPSIHDDDSTVVRKRQDCVVDDEILIVEQQHHITTTYNEDDVDVIDLSSESDVEDILELFHCYFCDETFRSLGALGLHVKKCSFCP